MRTPIPGWQKLTNINGSFFDFLRGHSFLQLRSGIYKLASYDTCFLAFPIQSFKHIHEKYGRCIIFLACSNYMTVFQVYIYNTYIYIYICILFSNMHDFSRAVVFFRPPESSRPAQVVPKSSSKSGFGGAPSPFVMRGMERQNFLLLQYMDVSKNSGFSPQIIH